MLLGEESEQAEFIPEDEELYVKSKENFPKSALHAFECCDQTSFQAFMCDGDKTTTR